MPSGLTVNDGMVEQVVMAVVDSPPENA